MEEYAGGATGRPTRRGLFPPAWGRPPTLGDSPERRDWIADHVTQDAAAREMRRGREAFEQELRGLQLAEARERGAKLDAHLRDWDAEYERAKFRAQVEWRREERDQLERARLRRRGEALRCRR